MLLKFFSVKTFVNTSNSFLNFFKNCWFKLFYSDFQNNYNIRLTQTFKITNHREQTVTCLSLYVKNKII